MSGIHLEDEILSLTNNSTSNLIFIQDAAYINAVKELRKRHLKESLLEKTDPTKLLSLQRSKRSLDFNELRRAANSVSGRCQFSQAGNDAPNVTERGFQFGHFSQLRRFNDDNDQQTLPTRRQQLINKIENIVWGVLSDISEGKHPKFTLRNQKLWSNCVFGERVSLKKREESQMISVSFSGANSRNKFSLILHLLSVIHQMLTKNTSCTRRELYYQNISRVKNQVAIDSAVRDVCCLLEAPQWDLGLLAASKGLLAGPLSIYSKDGFTTCCDGAGGVLIPQDVLSITNVESNAKFIMVVEKDAIFQKLLDEGALQRLGPCIIITGKGYPDVNTRLMLKLLVDTLRIPALALVDADPHGIEIMCTYRYGSLAMSHLAERLAVPSLHWLGIHPSDMTLLGVPTLQLSPRDVSKARDIISRPYCANGGPLRRQVELMINAGSKTEIEGVGSLSQAYLTDRYIPHKICANDFI